jgi:hypothetical protein
VLDDISTDALSTAVLWGFAHFAEVSRTYSAEEWERILSGHRDRGMRAILLGAVDRGAQNLTLFRPEMVGVCTGLAALAMRPGGVRVCQIVFCFAHYPAGTEARFRLSCPKCSPDDTMHSWPHADPRDVVSIEGTI